MKRRIKKKEKFMKVIEMPRLEIMAMAAKIPDVRLYLFKKKEENIG